MKVQPLGDERVKVTADCGCSVKTGELFLTCQGHQMMPDAQKFADHLKGFYKEAHAAVDLYNKQQHTRNFTKRDDEPE